MVMGAWGEGPEEAVLDELEVVRMGFPHTRPPLIGRLFLFFLRPPLQTPPPSIVVKGLRPDIKSMPTKFREGCGEGMGPIDARSVLLPWWRGCGGRPSGKEGCLRFLDSGQSPGKHRCLRCLYHRCAEITRVEVAERA